MPFQTALFCLEMCLVWCQFTRMSAARLNESFFVQIRFIFGVCCSSFVAFARFSLPLQRKFIGMADIFMFFFFIFLQWWKITFLLLWRNLFLILFFRFLFNFSSIKYLSILFLLTWEYYSHWKMKFCSLLNYTCISFTNISYTFGIAI